jgi:long-chain acyl-CoA synthetase
MCPAFAPIARRARIRCRKNLREVGPTYYFAPPRIFETLLTNVRIRMNDASRLKRWMFDRFIEIARKHGEAILERRPVAAVRAACLCSGRILCLWPAEERARHDLGAHRLHGR